MDACESADGYVYYHGYNDLQKRGIWRVPTSGGPETLVLDKAIGSLVWDLTDRGIYFIDGTTKPMALCLYDFATRSVSTFGSCSRRTRAGFPVMYFEFATGQMKQVSLIDGSSLLIGSSLTVSPDQRWILYSIRTNPRADIMLVENFR